MTTKPKPVATRGDGLHIVPSQTTERIQAVDIPPVWPRLRRFERMTEQPWGWIFALAMILGAIVLAAVAAL